MPEGTIERPLSPSLPRDCGHECKVCRVTVASLTEYASHISSPVHKQKVEASERRNGTDDPEEEYFDKELVDLVERRKEQLRYVTCWDLCVIFIEKQIYGRLGVPIT